ncbi:MAG: hypothetical protein IKH57_21235 [Clostridia bacterium]|nr:hypothetical protein [Clostridia bacterium]
MAQMGEIQHRGDPTDVKGVMNYVYQLEEQIRYVLQNLGSDNLAPGSVDVDQLGPNVTKQFNTIIQGQVNLENYTRRGMIVLGDGVSGLTTRITSEEGDITTLEGRADGFDVSISNLNGDITTLEGRADGFDVSISNLDGDITTLEGRADGFDVSISNLNGDITALEGRADGFDLSISNLNGDITALEGRADGLEARVTSEEGITSALGMTSAGIQMTGSKFVKITTTGSFIVNANGPWASMLINSDAPMINIGGTNSTDRLFQVGLTGNVYCRGLTLYDPNTQTWVDVTNAILGLV